MSSVFRVTGTAVPVLAGMALVCWVIMLHTISVWMGQSPGAGNETARIMQQTYSAALAVAVWVLLGGLLLMAGVKGVMPARAGFASWVALPVSGILGLIAIAAMYEPDARWAVAVPAAVPLLIGGYALYLFFPSIQIVRPMAAGIAMWSVVLALGLTPLPAAFRLTKPLRTHRSIEYKPGPELDRFMAEQREARRLAGMEVLGRVDQETTIGDLESLVRGDSPVRSAALEAMRHLPDRQAQAEKALLYDYSWILPLLPDIDIRPTPQLCQGARHYLRTYLEELRRQGPEPSSSMGAIIETGIHGVGWLAANCDCRAELDQLDELASHQLDTPAVRSVRESLAAFRKAK